MYGDFLKEAAGIWQDTRLFELGEQFIAVSFLWDAVAELLWKLSQTKDIRLLEMISQRVLVIYERESSLYHALMHLPLRGRGGNTADERINRKISTVLHS